MFYRIDLKLIRVQLWILSVRSQDERQMHARVSDSPEYRKVTAAKSPSSSHPDISVRVLRRILAGDWEDEIENAPGLLPSPGACMHAIVL